MCKEKFSVEQVTCIIENVCDKHGYDLVALEPLDGYLVVSFPSEPAIYSDLIVELARTIGYSLRVYADGCCINLGIPL